MKLHYFEERKADDDDVQLQIAILQGYVPELCLLGGVVVMTEVFALRDPCAGCNGPRHICRGRRKTTGSFI